MSDDASIERLLRWRLARAASEAPSAPSAAWLLALAEPAPSWTEQLTELVRRVRAMPVALGFAQAGPLDARHGHPVPTLIAHSHGTETYSRVLYLAVRDGWLRLRFQLDAGALAVGEVNAAPRYDVTFVADAESAPLLSATADVSVDHEYRLDAPLPDALARAWAGLRAADPMPFRLVLRPPDDAS